MIKKLRAKLIAVSMLSLSLVLLVIMGTVNIFNYRQIITSADSTLAILKENKGTFPKKDDEFHHPGEPGPKPMSPELPYESRYFSVLLSNSGSVISVDTGKIAAVNTQTAVQFAQKVWDSGRDQGFISVYRYAWQQEEDGIRIIFLDCARSLVTFRTFLAASCIISVLGLLSVLGLIILFSRRIIRPVLESYQKQKQFITDAGHEIKTPLSIIDADAEVLEMEMGENEWLRDIQQQVKRLGCLTNDLIFLSRMEENHNLLQSIDFPFSDMVEETAQSFLSLAKTQNKQLTIQIQPMISLWGDEKSLRQLVSILLDNALKYSSPHGSIALMVKKETKVVCLVVENTTDPISSENLPRLFDRFYREDKSRNSQTGGYGLGLSIAKAIVEAHKGKISARIIKEHFLTIQVDLPLRKEKNSEKLLTLPKEKMRDD